MLLQTGCYGNDDVICNSSHFEFYSLYLVKYSNIMKGNFVVLDYICIEETLHILYHMSSGATMSSS